MKQSDSRGYHYGERISYSLVTAQIKTFMLLLKHLHSYFCL